MQRKLRFPKSANIETSYDIIGLIKYGFTKEAKRIMINSVKTHAALFRKHGVFFEKLNGLTGEKPDNFQYETQTGFGWTNAIFYRYIKLLDELDNKRNIFKSTHSKKPPYELNAYH